MEEWEFLGTDLVDQFDNSTGDINASSKRIAMLKEFYKINNCAASDFMISDKCTDCKIERNRRYISLLRNRKGETRWVGEQCLAKYLPKIACSICNNLYKYDLSSCPNCRKMTNNLKSKNGKFGCENKPFNKILSQIDKNIEYRNYCIAHICGNVNSDFAKFVLDSKKLTRPKRQYDYMKSGKYKNCSVFHLHMALSGLIHNEEISTDMDDMTIQRLKMNIMSVCEICKEEFYVMDDERQYKFIKEYFHRDCKAKYLEENKIAEPSDITLKEYLNNISLVTSECRLCSYTILGESNGLCDSCRCKLPFGLQYKCELKCLSCNKYFIDKDDIKCNQIGRCEIIKFGKYKYQSYYDVSQQDSNYCRLLGSNIINNNIYLKENFIEEPYDFDVVINNPVNEQLQDYVNCSVIRMLKYIDNAEKILSNFSELFYIYKHEKLTNYIKENYNCLYKSIMTELNKKILNKDNGWFYKDFTTKYYNKHIYWQLRNLSEGKISEVWVYHKKYLVDFICYVNKYLGMGRNPPINKLSEKYWRNNVDIMDNCYNNILSRGLII